MPLGIFKLNNLPIGVDLGSSEVKLAQVRINNNSLELVAAGAEEIPSHCRSNLDERLRILSSCIRTILKSKPFKGRRSILSLPSEAMFVHHLKIPKVAPEQTTETLQLELQNKLPRDVHDMVIRHIVACDVLTEGRNKQEIIVMAAERQTLQAYLSMARKARLDVVGVNAGPCAIVECFSHLLRRANDNNRTILFIDMGASSTQVVLSHGSRIVFSRALQTGGDQLDLAVASAMGTSVGQAHALRRQVADGQVDGARSEELYRLLAGKIDETAAEISQCLRYYESIFKNRQLERAVFLGGQAHDKRLCEELAKRLNLPATVGDPLACIKRIPGAGLDAALDQRQPHPNWAVAVGLSLGADKAA